MAAAHRRHDMSDDVWERLRPHLPGGEGKRGRPGPGQPPLYRRRLLDPAQRRALARFAPGLRRLEEHPPPLLPLAGPGRVGQAAGGGDE